MVSQFGLSGEMTPLHLGLGMSYLTADGTIGYGIGRTNGDDHLGGRERNEIIMGLDGNDVLYSSLGADTLDGGAGMDTVSYANRTSAVFVSTTGTATQQSGDTYGDTYISIEGVAGGAFSDIVIGNAEDNRLWGGVGNDQLLGHAGDNILYGEAGDDQLTGGTGDDTFDGGDGMDMVLYLNSGTGVSVDLEAGTATGHGTDARLRAA